MADIAKDSTHWYDRSGQPVHQVQGAKGKPVTPDIRHARKLGLLPGVTGVLRIQHAPGLERWKIMNALEAALTLPRNPDESLDDFLDRAEQDGRETGRKAADRGTELHTALELAVQGRSFDDRWRPHVAAVDRELLKVGVDFLKLDAERSFAHHLGFGGKNDGHSKAQRVVLDYKSKDKIEPGKRIWFDTHIAQLSACAEGLLIPDARKLNVFVGVDDVQVVIKEWTPEEGLFGWDLFVAALNLWQVANRYRSGFQLQQEAA